MEPKTRDVTTLDPERLERVEDLLLSQTTLFAAVLLMAALEKQRSTGIDTDLSPPRLMQRVAGSSG